LICRIDVPDDYATIQDAVDAAANDCLIVVAEGTYHESVVIEDKAVRIVGDGDVVVRPDEDEPVFLVLDTPDGHVTQFDHLTFSSVDRYQLRTGGQIVIRKESGVAIAEGVASIRVTNCDFDDLSTGLMSGEGIHLGAGFFRFSSTIEVERCDFLTCAAGDGGAIAANGCDLSVDQSHFEQCSASGGAGGALWISGGQLALSQCRFDENTASWGGHAFFDTVDLEANRCLFQSGTATSGGAMASTGFMEADVTRCHFRSNQAEESADA
jgi:hypothetical protein